MACISVDTCQFRNILAALPELPPCNWLITDLECYDTSGWDGCEKWARRELFLTDGTLRRDVKTRDMQFIWGVFSAIDAEYSENAVRRYPLPEAETPRYMSNSIFPQHPLAFLELYAEDGCLTFVSARKSSLLEPLYRLPCEVRDEEADNRVMNAQLCRIQDTLRQTVPEVSPQIANAVQWQVWWALFRKKTGSISDQALHAAVMAEYHAQRLSPSRFPAPYWDPYAQK
mgnify:CR=1 FL=1